MYNCWCWPGAYNFKQEIGLFLKYISEQIDELMKKIDEADRLYN